MLYFTISVADPTFNPAAPVLINGYHFVPVDQADEPGKSFIAGLGDNAHLFTGEVEVCRVSEAIVDEIRTPERIEEACAAARFTGLASDGEE